MMEEANVPALAHMGQENHQSTGALREFESIHPFVADVGWMSANHMSDMQFRHIVVCQIADRIAVLIKCFQNQQPFGIAVRQTDAYKNLRVREIGISIVEFRDAPLTEDFAELSKAALLFRNGDGEESLAGFTDFGAFGNMPQTVEISYWRRC